MRVLIASALIVSTGAYAGAESGTVWVSESQPHAPPIAWFVLPSGVSLLITPEAPVSVVQTLVSGTNAAGHLLYCSTTNSLAESPSVGASLVVS